MTDTTTGTVVPFGKYKGQPVETLAADAGYCEWLMSQPWFRDRFPNVYNVVINYGGEPQDSPEHNQMQAKFLEDDWCLRLGTLLVPLATQEVRHRSFEASGWDVTFWVVTWVEFSDGTSGTTNENVYVECKPDLGDDYPAVLRQVQRYRNAEYWTGTACVVVRRHNFEHVTWDQVREIFAASRIRLLAESELAAAIVPAAEALQVNLGLRTLKNSGLTG